MAVREDLITIFSLQLWSKPKWGIKLRERVMEFSMWLWTGGLTSEEEKIPLIAQTDLMVVRFVSVMENRLATKSS